MNIHEYQAKQILNQYNIPIPLGYHATNAQEAQQQAQQLGGEAWMIKAQVHAGGRGKAGGIKKAENLNEVMEITNNFIGTSLVTHQTGGRGKLINGVLVENPTAIKSELYLSLVVDRSKQRIAVIASAAGGMDIETVAAKTPEKIVSQTIDPIVGIQAYQCRDNETQGDDGHRIAAQHGAP